MEDYQPGDIVEIETSAGLAYVQLTHTHPSYPPVVKFLKGPFQKRPEAVTVLAREASPIAMVPLSGVLKKLGLKHARVGTVEIPRAEREFPIFRMPIRDKKGEIIYWWFWDGEGLRYDADPDASTNDMPLREITTADALLEKLSAA